MGYELYVIGITGYMSYMDYGLGVMEVRDI
jgi:hypothetical protein